MRGFFKRFAVMATVAIGATISISTPAQAANYAQYMSKRQNVCLDSDSAGEVYQLGCNSGGNRQWDLQKITGDLYYPKSKATSRCLDANSSNDVYTLSCNDGENQRWRRVYPSGNYWGQWINVKTGRCLSASVYAGKRNIFTSVCENTASTDVWSRRHSKDR